MRASDWTSFTIRMARCSSAPVLALLCLLAVLMAAGLDSAWSQGVRAGLARITLTSTPTSIPADGKSRARIRIEVRDRNNDFVPDGTPVLCHSDACLLSSSGADWQPSLTVTTRAGYAVVYAQSQQPGPATVIARVQDSRQQVTLQFLAKGEVEQGKSRVLNVRGGWVGYCLELNTIVARDGARAQFGNLVFDAGDGLEVNLDSLQLRAWGVRISRGSEQAEAEDCFFDMAARRGVYRYFSDDGVERVGFTPYGLKGSAAEWELPPDAFRRDDRDGATWMVCNSISFFVGEKIVLRHAALYAGGEKVFSFPPYWVIGLAGYSGASNSQVVGVSSDGGLAVDFPFFYRVTDTWAGSVRIQRGASGTSFVARDGWSLGLAEEYNSGDVKGAIEAGGLFSKTWGLAWRDERPVFGDHQGYFSVGWPDHKSLFADASLYHYGDSYRFNLRGRYDHPRDTDPTYGVTADWLTEPNRFSGNATYRLGTSVGAQRPLESSKWVFENELYGALDFDTWRLGRHTTLTAGFSNVYSWDTADYASNTLRADLRLSHEFGSQAYLSLDYYLTHASGDATVTGFSHLFGLDLNLTHGSLWSTYLSGTWDASSGDTYGYAALNYYMKPAWRLGVMATHYDFESTRFDDLEFVLARSLGNREIGLSYSLDSGRISLELGDLGLGW